MGHVHRVQQGLVHHHHIVRRVDVAVDAAPGVADAVVGCDGRAHALGAVLGKALDELARGKGGIRQEQAGRLGPLSSPAVPSDFYCFFLLIHLSIHLLHSFLLCMQPVLLPVGTMPDGRRPDFLQTKTPSCIRTEI